MSAAAEAYRLAIRQTRVRVAGHVIVTKPKTAKSRRTLPVDESTAAALKAWRDVRDAERKESPEAWTDTGYVFTREDGQPYYPQYITARFHKLGDRAKLPESGYTKSGTVPGRRP